MKDAIPLLAQNNPHIIVIDKTGDAERLYQYYFEKSIEAHIPLQEYRQKIVHNNWSYQKKAAKKISITHLSSQRNDQIRKRKHKKKIRQ